METKEKLSICKVVCQAILIDGFLTDKERDYLDGVMDKYELDADQRKEVMRRNIDDDPALLAEDISTEEAKNAVIIEVGKAIISDGDFAKTEKKLLSKVAVKIGYTDEKVEEILKNEKIIS
ncbi:hypothetical protein KKF34_10215 [Myxococcota bacterium]|nr:hypothetical protein [Myxococcota bacterium]MBU1382669.1 hypothetical protein [Myxococcota bacterium]MBU1497239.1 hypothetical protein [Myxococcota bacterium]